MHFIDKKPEEKRIDLDQKLKSKNILRVPGAYNPLTAKIIEEIGYDAVYVSGGVMSNDLGYPDIGLTSLKDVASRSKQIARVTNLPTIVDIDTGFKSCEETIQTFEKFGISAVHIEDQIDQKRCGHLDNKELISKTSLLTKDLGVIMGDQKLNSYIKSVIEISFLTNKYINDEEPWKLKKTNIDRMNNILHLSLEQIRKISILLNPIIPIATNKVLDSLNLDNKSRDISSLYTSKTLKKETGFPKNAPGVKKCVQNILNT